MLEPALDGDGIDHSDETAATDGVDCPDCGQRIPLRNALAHSGFAAVVGRCGACESTVELTARRF